MELRRLYVFIGLLFWVACMAAQNRQTVGDEEYLTVSGHIYGTDELEPMPYPLPNANVTMLCLNDTLAGREACATDKKGEFHLGLGVLKKRIKKKESARVRLRVSFVGYETFEKEYTMTQQYFNPNRKSSGYYWQLELDSIVLRSKPMSSEEVLIVDELKRMYESGDTTVFNVDAFMMPRGTVLLNLVRRLPGLRYDQGVLTYRDSVISEIRLNGESFFANDMKIALDNIENTDLKQFRIYHDIDTISMDSSRLVADMITKEPVNRVEVAKPELGTSNKKNTYRLLLQNVRWNSGEKGEWATMVTLDDLPQASTWKNSQNSIHGSYNRKIKKMYLNGNAQYNYTDQRRKSESLSATVMPDYQQYSRGTSQSKSYNNSYNQYISGSGNIRKVGSISASMNISSSNTHSHDWSKEATYNDNPFTADGQELLSEQELRAIGLTNITNNRHQRRYNDNMTFSANFNKSFNKKVRSHISVSTNYSHNHSYNTNYEKRETEYLQYGDSVWSYERYSTSPNNSDNFRMSANYSLYLNKQDSPFNYNVEFSYTYSNNTSVGGTNVYDVANGMAFIDSLSTRNRNTTIEHNMTARYNFSYKSIRINLSMGVSPMERGYRNEQMDGFVADTTIHGIRYNPYISVYYNYGMNKSLGLSYNASNELPAPSNLVTSSTKYNPLNIRKPNPDLKQTIRHNFSLNWNIGNGCSMNSSVNFTRNNISQRTIYNPTTGGTISMPININGAWGLNNSFNYRTDFKHANLSVNGGYSYSRGVRYQRTTAAQEDIIGYSDNHTIRFSSRFMVYGKKYDLSLDGGYSYQWDKTNYTTERDRVHSYGLNSKLNIWPTDRLTLTTDLNVNGQAGYRTADANRADIIWNLHAEYKFLRNYRATVKLSWYDILRNWRNYSGSHSGTSWSESRTSGTSTYALMTFQYKLYKMK